MKINKPLIYKYCRLIHRYFSLITFLSGLLMVFTGAVMKYDFLENLFSFINPQYYRYLHNIMSPLFGFSFFIMATTGMIMYFLTNNNFKA